MVGYNIVVWPGATDVRDRMFHLVRVQGNARETAGSRAFIDCEDSFPRMAAGKRTVALLNEDNDLTQRLILLHKLMRVHDLFQAKGLAKL